MEDLSTIRIRRKQLGITQKQLAKKAGVSQSLIAKIERGKIDPRYSFVVAIFNALNELETQQMISVKKKMRRGVITVAPKDSIDKALMLMKQHGISQLPVKEKDIVVGSLSEEALFTQLIEHGDDVKKKRCCDVMEPPFPIVDENTPLDTVKHLLKTQKAVLIIKKGKLVGIITKSDVI